MNKVLESAEVRQEVIGYRVVSQQPDSANDSIIVYTEQGEPQTYILSKPPQVAEAAPAGQEYVDPYLFETGYFASREEYEELSRTAKIIPRAKA